MTSTSTALPVITLAKVKYFAAGSEETSCFVAEVLIDGTKVADARNDGKGGCTFIFPWTAEKQLTDIAKQMPAIMPDITPNNDAEMLIDDLLSSWLMDKDLKKSLASRFLFSRADGKVYETKPMKKDAMAAHMAKGHDAIRALFAGAVQVLNFLPFEEARAIYRGTSGKG
jgi:hypothetical protein